ncbi:unnamed protein product, partial [Trichogramma brassicae]
MRGDYTPESRIDQFAYIRAQQQQHHLPRRFSSTLSCSSHGAPGLYCIYITTIYSSSARDATCQFSESPTDPDSHRHSSSAFADVSFIHNVGSTDPRAEFSTSGYGAPS